MILKFHHALTDGVGGIQIAMILFDRRRPMSNLRRWRDRPSTPPPRPRAIAHRPIPGRFGGQRPDGRLTEPRARFPAAFCGLWTPVSSAAELAASVYLDHRAGEPEGARR